MALMKITTLTTVTNQWDVSVTLHPDTTDAAKSLRQNFDPENEAGEDIESFVEGQGVIVDITEHDLPLCDVDSLIRQWYVNAAMRDDEEGQDPRRDATIAATLRDCATDLEVALGLIDRSSPASIQHYIETGRYLRHGEAEEI